MSNPAIDQTRTTTAHAAADTDGVLATFADLDRIRWDGDEVDQTPAMELGDILASPVEVDKWHNALSHLEAISAATEKEIARLQARTRAINTVATDIRHAILNAMETAKTTHLHGQYCTLQRKLNPPAVRIEDVSLIPDTYMRQQPPPPPLPDKAAIRAAIEHDVYVPGAILTRGSRLERR